MPRTKFRMRTDNVMSYRPATSLDYSGAKRYALTRLERELPATIFYHSLWHTRDEVAARARWLAQEEGLSSEMQQLITTAAYFHDIGFVNQRVDHELVSARIAAGILPNFGFRPDHIALVQGMIMATELPQTPHNRLEEIIADADLDVLGRADFFSRNNALRAELATAGVITSDESWYVQQACFIQHHRYFTKAARRQRAQRKWANLQELHSIISDCCTQVNESPITIPNPSFAVS
jgi:uncharacterized protein